MNHLNPQGHGTLDFQSAVGAAGGYHTLYYLNFTRLFLSPRVTYPPTGILMYRDLGGLFAHVRGTCGGHMVGVSGSNF